MKVLLGGRGSGITTDLILESAKFHTPILVLNKSLAQCYLNKAKELNVTIPNPLIVSENFSKGTNVDSIIIDNFTYILKYLLKEKGIDIKNITTIGDGFETIY